MNRGRIIGAAIAAALLVGAAVLRGWPIDTPQGTPGPQPATVPPTTASIEGRIALAADSGPVPDGTTVVVYAYAAEGAPGLQALQLPLAVLRWPASALPLDFKLDDSQAPNTEHRLSRMQQLVIGARLGQGGEALAQVGDWVAVSQRVAPGTQGVQLVLQPPPK